MRKIILTLISISLFALACNDEAFLEKDPHTLTDRAFYTSVSGAQQGLIATYDILQFGEDVQRIEFNGTVCSGDAMAGGEPGGNDQPSMQSIMKFIIFPNNAYVTSYWRMMYRGVYRCNLLLNYLDEESGADLAAIEAGFPEDLREQIIGQALFLRGLYHFKLQINYGGFNDELNDASFGGAMMGVPFIDKVLPPDEWLQERPTLSETWDKIEADFTRAASLLHTRSEYPAEDMGRATKGAAQAMLAKSHLYQNEFEDAYQAALQVVNSGEYALVGGPDYPGPFTITRSAKEGDVPVDVPGYKWIFQPEGNNSIEGIFEVQHFQEGSTRYPQGGEGNLVPQYYGPRNVWTYNTDGDLVSTGYFWGFILPTDYFVETAYDDIGCEVGDEILDPRFKLSVVSEGDSLPYYYTDATLRETYPDSVLYDSWYNWPTTGRCTWKYFTDPMFSGANAATLADYPQNTKYMRYADLLLIGAEAAIQSGHDADALTWVNLVRERARMCGNTGYPEALTSVTVEDVWAERRVELAFEGHQYFDIVRTGRAQQVLKEDAMQFSTMIHPDRGEEGVQQWGSSYQIGKHEIWPIPEEEMDNSEGSITQNPNYD
jgi:hypothetical protein